MSFFPPDVRWFNPPLTYIEGSVQKTVPNPYEEHLEKKVGVLERTVFTLEDNVTTLQDALTLCREQVESKNRQIEKLKFYRVSWMNHRKEQILREQQGETFGGMSQCHDSESSSPYREHNGG